MHVPRHAIRGCFRSWGMDITLVSEVPERNTHGRCINGVVVLVGHSGGCGPGRCIDLLAESSPRRLGTGRRIPGRLPAGCAPASRAPGCSIMEDAYSL